MASEQLVRRENTTTERELGVEKDRVPKMTDHFEHLADKAKESDISAGQGSIEALQGGEQVQEHAGKAIGDVGGRGKAREIHELGSHFESLADKVKDEDHNEKLSDHAENIVGNKEGTEGAVTEREARGGSRDVGKFETKTEGEERGAEEEKDKEKLRRRIGTENEGASPATAVITCSLEQGNTKDQKPREESEGEKQAASETLNNTAKQAKDATLEKGQQGYATTKDTISSAAKTASEKTAPVVEKAKGYTLQAAEKAKSAGGTTASYVGEKAVQAKDITVEGGKSAAGYAAKVAADLKDKATAAGWTAAHFSTEKTVDGTKAAAHVVEGAAGYAGHKAAQLASMSAGAVKGLAASAGDSAKGYTAKKKDEAWRQLEAKNPSQPQLGEEKPSEGIGETVSKVGEKVKKPFENMMGGEKKESGGQEEGKGAIGQTLTSISEKLGDAKQREVLLDNITEGGSEVFGAIGETVAEIGQNMMKPVDIVQEHGQVGQEGGLLSAIGETIAEIAETTRVIVAGEGERESTQSVGSESCAKHEERSHSA
ncbi:Seed biotin-containing protein SBP65, partial [Mucuna pruriens]